MTRTTPSVRLFTRWVATLVLSGLALAACSDDNASTTPTLAPPPRITVTSLKDDPKSQLLAAIYARLLEDAGFRVTRRDPVSMDRAEYYAEVKAGTIDVIPEWTGELLHYLYSLPGTDTSSTTTTPDTTPASTVAPVVIETTTTVSSETTTADSTADSTADTTTADTTADTAADTTTTADSTTTTVAATSTTAAPTTTLVVDPNGSTTTTIATVSTRGVAGQIVAIQAALDATVVINSGALAEDKTVIACTTAAVESMAGFEFTTLTNLASNAPKIRLGATTEWQDDRDAGLPAFLHTYGGEFKEIVTVDDPGAAASAGDADCVAINSLDPEITGGTMTVLTDDATMLPGNGAIALVNAEIGTPDLLAAIDGIASSLTTDALNRMLRQITNEGADPVELANAFVDSL